MPLKRFEITIISRQIEPDPDEDGWQVMINEEKIINKLAWVEDEPQVVDVIEDHRSDWMGRQLTQVIDGTTRTAVITKPSQLEVSIVKRPFRK